MFALQYEEEVPTVDTFAGMFSIASCSVYVLIDTSASCSCISEECVLACGLTAKTLPSVDMRVSTPLGFGSPITKLVKSVEVEIEDLHLPIDMLVLSMSDFDVILGMDWLNRYRVVIDCHEMTLSFKIRGVEVEHKLEKP